MLAHSLFLTILLQGKKKKSTLPWCFYCDREFEDDKILVNHQKAKVGSREKNTLFTRLTLACKPTHTHPVAWVNACWKPTAMGSRRGQALRYLLSLTLTPRKKPVDAVSYS